MDHGLPNLALEPCSTRGELSSDASHSSSRRAPSSSTPPAPAHPASPESNAPRRRSLCGVSAREEPIISSGTESSFALRPGVSSAPCTLTAAGEATSARKRRMGDDGSCASV
eukprot:scaffold52724_cov26-Tisochrysis_lutea.AAC.1